MIQLILIQIYQIFIKKFTSDKKVENKELLNLFSELKKLKKKPTKKNNNNNNYYYFHNNNRFK